MIWDNTRLLLGLLYRPVSAMGRIVDEGHWLYAAVVVAALSMVFHATVTVVIYNNYEAVYHALPPAPESSTPQAEELENPTLQSERGVQFQKNRTPQPVNQPCVLFVPFCG